MKHTIFSLILGVIFGSLLANASDLRLIVDQRVGHKSLQNILAAIEDPLTSKYDGVDVTFFGGNAQQLSEPANKYVWGKRPVFEPFDPKKVHLTLDQSLFSNSSTAAIEKARLSSAKANEAARATFVAEVQRQFAALLANFDTLPTGKAKSNLAEVAARLLNENAPRNLIVTTGAFDPLVQVKTLKNVPLVAFIVTDDSASIRCLDARQRSLQQTFPSATFVQPYVAARALDFIEGKGQISPVNIQVMIKPRALPERAAHRHDLTIATSTSSISSTSLRGADLAIVSPAQRALVGQALSIEFTGAMPGNHYRAVVHPLGPGGDSFWQMEEAEVRPGATAIAPAVIGRPGLIDCGIAYDVRVFENPRSPARAGPLPAWPPTDGSSIAVTVIRGADCPSEVSHATAY